MVSKICRLVPVCLIEPSSSVPNTADTLSGRLILPENVERPDTLSESNTV